MMFLQFSAAILSFGAFHTKSWPKNWQLNPWFSNKQRHAYVVEHSRRTTELVVNHSRRFYESLKHELLTPFVAFLGRTDNLEKRKIGEPQTQESILLGDSMNLRESLVWKASIINWLPKIEGISLKLKTRSGSYSGLDKSIQATKKTVKISCDSPFKSDLSGQVGILRQTMSLLLLFCGFLDVAYSGIDNWKCMSMKMKMNTDRDMNTDTNKDKDIDMDTDTDTRHRHGYRNLV
jgi:hypothetical protein